MSKKVVFVIPDNIFFTEVGELNLNSYRPFIKIWLKRTETRAKVRLHPRPNRIMRTMQMHEVLQVFNTDIIQVCFSNADIILYEQEISAIRSLLLWKYCKSPLDIVAKLSGQSHTNISHHARKSLERASVDKKYNRLLTKIFTYYDKPIQETES